MVASRFPTKRATWVRPMSDMAGTIATCAHRAGVRKGLGRPPFKRRNAYATALRLDPHDQPGGEHRVVLRHRTDIRAPAARCVGFSHRHAADSPAAFLPPPW